MKKAIIPIILGTVLCIGLSSQPDEEVKPTPAPTFTPPQAKVCEVPMPEIEIPEAEIEVIIATPLPMHTQTPAPVPTPEPTPTATPVPTQAPVPVTTQSVQVGDMVYVPGFGWLESQGEGAVIHDENIYENGNKVGSMD